MLKIDAKIERKLLAGIISPLVECGVISTEELEDKQKVLEKLRHLLSKTPKIHLITDYTESLVRTGDSFLNDGEYDNARLFHATFFEHIANSVISIGIERKSFPEKVRMEVLRNVNLAGKLSWMLQLLELPNFNDSHRKTILNLAEKRNAYVHYKYLPDPRDDRHPSINSKELEEELRAVRRAITYAKRYESLVRYGKSKKTTHKKVRNLANAILSDKKGPSHQT